MHRFRLFSFLVVCFALTATAAFSQSTLKIEDLKIPEVPGWIKGKAGGSLAEPNGYIVPFNSEAGNIGAVTVYIYHGGLKNIPNSLDGIVEDHFEETKGALYQIEKMGRYKNVKEVKSEKSAIGGDKGKTKAHHAVFTYEAMVQGGELQSVVSDIYLFSYKGYFGKIRATRSPGEASEKEVQKLMAALDTVFSK